MNRNNPNMGLTKTLYLVIAQVEALLLAISCEKFIPPTLSLDSAQTL